MEIFFLAVFGLYILFIISLLYGWEVIISSKAKNNNSIHHSISVIIPFRNEEQNLGTLVKSLASVQYPADKLEFIFVNDHSLDGSVSLLVEANLKVSKIIDLESGKTGKKAAITAGVNSSSADVIVTTDADCTHSPDWLESINSCFADSNINMVIGAVAISPAESFLDKLQSIEFASLVGSGASLLQWKIPAMANGANLAFRREMFLKVKGYEGNDQIASGDDEYLLQKFFAVDPLGILFNSHPYSVVNTSPQDSLWQFFQQRLRWAGKWKFQGNVKVRWLAILVFVFQITFISAIVNSLLTGNRLIVTLLMTKAVMEAIFLFRVCEFIKVRLSLIPFILLQVIYPFYVVLTAIGSLFLSFEWKGRKY